MFSGQLKNGKIYRDVENEMIEDNLNAQKITVELDGDYVLSLKTEYSVKETANTEKVL